MSRPVIGAITALAIALLTALAYKVSTGGLESKIENDLTNRVAKAQELLVQNTKLEMLSLLQKGQGLARDPGFVEAMARKKVDAEGVDRVLQKYRAKLGAMQETQPDILAVTGPTGQLISLLSENKAVLNPIPDTYFENGKLEYKTLALALEQRHATSTIFNYESAGAHKMAVAPISDSKNDVLLGGLLVGYALNNPVAKESENMLGMKVVFFNEGSVAASSFGKKEAVTQSLSNHLFKEGLAKQALEADNGLADLATIELEGSTFVATAGKLPQFSSQPPLPKGVPDRAGAMVLASRSKAMSAVSSVKAALVILGLGSILVALMAMFLATKKILSPLDEIENGVNDIINGNYDRTFRPVSSDLDGLSNALNVMLARLLGRPEPGEETFDDDGNIIRSTGTGGMRIAPAEMSPKEAEAMSLAQEPRDSYLNRLFEEYCEARKATGEGVDGVTLDGFSQKLAKNEEKLIQRYKCKEVRFKVLVDGENVTLKPVPIV